MLDTRFAALYALSNLAFDPANAKPITEGGAIRPLIALLGSNHGQRIQLSAMITLSSLLQTEHNPPAPDSAEWAADPAAAEAKALAAATDLAEVEETMKAEGCVPVLQRVFLTSPNASDAGKDSYPLKFFARELLEALHVDTVDSVRNPDALPHEDCNANLQDCAVRGTPHGSLDSVGEASSAPEHFELPYAMEAAAARAALESYPCTYAGEYSYPSAVKLRDPSGSTERLLEAPQEPVTDEERMKSVQRLAWAAVASKFDPFSVPVRTDSIG